MRTDFHRWQEYIVHRERGEWCPNCALPCAVVATHVWVDPDTLEWVCRRQITWCMDERTQVSRGAPQFAS